MNDKVKEALETLANLVYTGKDYVISGEFAGVFLRGKEAGYFQGLIQAKDIGERIRNEQTQG